MSKVFHYLRLVLLFIWRILVLLLLFRLGN